MNIKSKRGMGLQGSKISRVGRSSLLKNSSVHTMVDMRTKAFLVLLLLAGAVQAGPVQLEPKDTAPPPDITKSEPWHFELETLGWLAGVYGDIGLKGVTANVGVDFGKILPQIKGVASFGAEARKGRFGVYADILYLSMEKGIYGDGLVSKLTLNMSEYLADGEVFYRAIEGPRGYLDLRAGGRYIDIYTSNKLIADKHKIDEAATDLTNALAGDLKDLLKRILEHRLDGNNPPLPVPPLGEEAKKNLLKAIIKARQDPVTAQAHIAQLLNNKLNQTLALTERWADPYIGIAGSFNLTKVFYVTGRADVGGFGVASDITGQVYGAVGCHITRNIYSEVGYRCLFYDYDSGGFLFDTRTRGFQIVTGITF